MGFNQFGIIAISAKPRYHAEMVVLLATPLRAPWHGCSMMLLAFACAACAALPEPVPVVASCTVTDGDTIRCGDEKIRLLGIDTPEKPGACRAGRECASGDPFAASAALGTAMENGPIRIIRLGRDRYGRTLGSVFAGKVNLSCRQLAAGYAIYVGKWDNRRAIERACPDLAERATPAR